MKGLVISAMLVLGLGLSLQRSVPPPPNLAARVATLRAERDGLAGNDDALLTRLRQEAAAAPAVTWTSTRMQQWIGGLGPGWRVQSGAEPGVWILNRQPDHVGDWVPFLAVLREWSGLAGATVEAVEIEAVGPINRRRFTRRSVTLRFAMAEENSTQTKP